MIVQIFETMFKFLFNLYYKQSLLAIHRRASSVCYNRLKILRTIRHKSTAL